MVYTAVVQFLSSVHYSAVHSVRQNINSLGRVSSLSVRPSVRPSGVYVRAIRPVNVTSYMDLSSPIWNTAFFLASRIWNWSR